MAGMRIMVVDDDASFREPLAGLMKDWGHQVDECADGQAAIDKAGQIGGACDVFLIDCVLVGGPSGLETMRALRRQFPSVPTVMFTGWGDQEVGVQALKEGALQFLVKPFHPDQLKVLLRYVQEAGTVQRERAWLTALVKVTAALHSRVNRLDDVLQVIAAAVPDLTGANESAISLLDQRTGRFKVHFAVWQGSLAWQRHYREGSLSQNIVEAGKPVLIADTRHDTLINPQVPNSGVLSLVGVPIGRLGVLYAYGRQADQFRVEDVQALSALAVQAELAIDDALRLEELAVLNDIGQAISSVTDLPAALETIYRETGRLMDTTNLYIALYDKAAGMISFPFAVHGGTHAEHLPQYAPRPFKRGLTEHVISTQEPLLLSKDVRTQVRAMGVEPIGTPSLAWLGVPMTAGDEVLGVLAAQSFERENLFNERHAKILVSISNYAAVAIQNARLFTDARHKGDQLSQLQKAGEALAGALDLKPTLLLVVDGVQAVFNTPMVALWPYEAVQQHFDLESGVVKGIPEDDRHLISWRPRPGGIVATVMERGYIFVPDVQDPTVNFISKRRRAYYQKNKISCLAGIRLRAGDENVGILLVYFTEKRPFGPDQEITLRAFANQAALAIKKARIIDASQRRLEFMEKATGFMTLRKSFTEFGQELANGLMQVLGCDCITLYTYDDSRQQLSGVPIAAGLRFPNGVSRLGRVEEDSVVWRIFEFEKGEAHFAPDAAHDPVMRREFVPREGVVSSAGLPLIAGDRKVGILFLNYRRPHQFPPDEQAFIVAFCNQIAVALHNAQLYNEASRRLQYLEMVQAAGQRVAGTIDLEPILDHILDEAIILTEMTPGGKKAQLATIQLLEGRELQFMRTHPSDLLDKLRGTESYGVNLDVGMLVDERRAVGVTGRAAITGASQLVYDVSTDKDLVPLPGRRKIGSELAVPLIARDKILGVLNVEHNEPNAFSRDDQIALEALATQAVIAIQNAERYAELKKTKGLVGARTALVWMGMASTAWQHTTRNKASNIRGQVTNARLAIQRGEVSREKVEEWLAFIDGQAEEIERPPITPPLSTEEGVESVRLNALLRERIPAILRASELRNVNLHWKLELGDLATVKASREWLRRVVDILVQNALEAMQNSRKKVLTVSTKPMDRRVEILIADTGRGIPPGIIDKLFVKPIQKEKGEKGSGMGLLITEAIVSAYGGTIALRHTGPDGTTFAIGLPLE